LGLALSVPFYAATARADLAVGRALDIPGTPTYVVLDRQGRVVYFFAGEINNLRKFLDEMLAHLKF